MKFLLLILFCPIYLLAQNPLVKPVFTDSPDSAVVSLRNPHAFDKYGHYLFEYQNKAKEYYITTSEGNTGPFASIEYTYSNNAEVTFCYKNKDDRVHFYYRNTRGTTLYGPVSGHVEWQWTDNSKDMVALTVSMNDSLYLYIDNRMVGKTIKTRSNYIDWCTFSEDGHALYYVPKDSTYFLYLDDRLIDTSRKKFFSLHVINGGFYTYTKAHERKSGGEYDHLFFIHTPDTIIGPVLSVSNSYLNEDGSYYFTGNDDPERYLLVNNRMYKSISGIHDLLVRDRRNYLFTFIYKGKHLINANGRIYDSDDYDQISLANMDSGGHFSFFQEKNFYLYKYVNGKKVAKPVSRYGVRGVPLYIDPKGSSVHYFQTDDSTYIYRDDRLLLPPVANTQRFAAEPWNNVLAAFPPREQPGRRHQLVYFSIGNTGYFLFNGTLSRPMLNMQNLRGSADNIGKIIAGTMDNAGYYVIQKTADKTYTVTINNTSYNIFDGIDDISKDDCFFDGQEFIFYARKGLSYYQYTIRL